MSGAQTGLGSNPNRRPTNVCIVLPAVCLGTDDVGFGLVNSELSGPSRFTPTSPDPTTYGKRKTRRFLLARGNFYSMRFRKIPAVPVFQHYYTQEAGSSQMNDSIHPKLKRSIHSQTPTRCFPEFVSELLKRLLG